MHGAPRSTAQPSITPLSCGAVAAVVIVVHRWPASRGPTTAQGRSEVSQCSASEILLQSYRACERCKRITGSPQVAITTMADAMRRTVLGVASCTPVMAYRAMSAKILSARAQALQATSTPRGTNTTNHAMTRTVSSTRTPDAVRTSSISAGWERDTPSRCWLGLGPRRTAPQEPQPSPLPSLSAVLPAQSPRNPEADLMQCPSIQDRFSCRQEGFDRR